MRHAARGDVHGQYYYGKPDGIFLKSLPKASHSSPRKTSEIRNPNPGKTETSIQGISLNSMAGHFGLQPLRLLLVRACRERRSEILAISDGTRPSARNTGMQMSDPMETQRMDFMIQGLKNLSASGSKTPTPRACFPQTIAPLA